MRYIKTFESIARAKSFIGNKMQQYEKLKEILSKNPGYVGQMTEWLFDEKIPLNDLENLYNRLINLKRNGRSISIDDRKFEKVVDEVLQKEKEVDVYRIVNKMSTNPKNIVKNILSENNYTKENTFNLFYKISKKEPEFIRKFLSRSASFKSIGDIEKYYKILDIGVVNTKEAIREKIKDLKDSYIVYDQDNILALQVCSYEDMKQIGNDCTWCIVQYESHWNSYCNNRYQFIVWNFNFQEFESLFKVGITMEKNSSVYAAFDYMNTNGNNYAKEIIAQIDLKPSYDIAEKIKEEEEKRKIKYLESLIDDVRHTTSAKSLKEIYYGSDYQGPAIYRLGREYAELKIEMCLKVVKNFFGSLNINSNGLTRVKSISDSKFEEINRYLSEIFERKKIIYTEDLDKIVPNFGKFFIRNYENFNSSLANKLYEETYRPGKNIYIIDKIVDKIGDDDFISVCRKFPNWLRDKVAQMGKDMLLSFNDSFRKILDAKSPLEGMGVNSFNDLKFHFELFEKIYKRIKKKKIIQQEVSREFNLLKVLFGDSFNEKSILNEYRIEFWYIYNLPFEVKQPLNIEFQIPFFNYVPIDLIRFEGNSFEIFFDSVKIDYFNFALRFTSRCKVIIKVKPYYINIKDFGYEAPRIPPEKMGNNGVLKDIYLMLNKYNKKFMRGDKVDLIPGKLELHVI